MRSSTSASGARSATTSSMTQRPGSSASNSGSRVRGVRPTRPSSATARPGSGWTTSTAMAPKRRSEIAGCRKPYFFPPRPCLLKPVKAAFIQLNLAPVKCMCEDYFRKKIFYSFNLNIQPFCSKYARKVLYFLDFAQKRVK